MSTEEKSREQRLAEFEAKKQAREADEAKRLREEIEDVEMRFDAELGPRGKEWDYVVTRDGPIVVVRGEQVALKKFLSSKMTQVDVENFVRPLVRYPDAAKYMALVDKCPIYATRCGQALADLYGMKSKEDEGKF